MRKKRENMMSFSCFFFFRSVVMAVLFPVGAVIVGCLFLLTFSERFSVSITHFTPYEPHCEKTGLRGFRPGPIQTGLYNHTRWLEA